MSEDPERLSNEDDSFFEEEEEPGDKVRRCSPQSPPFDVEDSWDNNRDSFVTALENPGDLSSPPPDGPGVMSTIEEESRSYETSIGGASASVSKLVGEGEEKTCSEEVPPVVPPSGSSNPHITTPSQSNEEEEGLEALLRKLERLESAQNVLEDVLNTGVPENVDINALIAQFPLDSAQLAGNSNKEAHNWEDDQSQRSFSSEIASIQKLIDGGDSISINSEVAGGNNDVLSSDANPQEINSRGRAVEDVLKEYEELERSISCASVIDESFQSDVSSVPPFSTHSNQAAEKAVPVTLPSTSHSIPPVIKPPVLKTVVPPPPTTNKPVTAPANPPHMFSNSTQEYYDFSSDKNPNHGHDSTGNSSRTRPMTSNPPMKNTPVPRSSRIESSQSAHGIKPNATSQSARATASAITTSIKGNSNQDTFKPRNRRMRSPRTIASPRQPQDNDKFLVPDIPTSSSARGGGDCTQVIRKDKNNSHQSQHKANRSVENVEAVVAAEALKTIEKLNTMVTRQETLLGAYSKDNEKLWEQLREAKTESQEKEVKFQDVINSLKTEVATLKLNRLVTLPAPAPSNAASHKAELQKIREDSELKSQQLLELRKEVLHLQSKLATRQTRPPTEFNKQPTTAHPVSEEKEKEYQKMINGLNKQVRTLQRILYSKDETAPPPPPPSSEGNRVKPMQRTKSDVQRRQTISSISNAKHIQQQRSHLRNALVDTSGILGKRSSNKSVNINTGEVLQASLNCLEQEREEFENIIENKNKLIFDKEKTILSLKEQMETLKSQLPDGDVVEPGLIDELRSRIITQNKVIQTLKGHLSTFKKMEAENIYLREEKCTFEQQARDLRKRLEFAQSLVKPENEVLCLLSEKVDELNSRYYQRERQLDTLLSRLTVKTTTGTGGALSSSSSNDSDAVGRLHSTNLSPRRRLPLGQFSNNNVSLGGALLTSSIGGKGRSSAIISADILHMVDLSPTNSFQLFDTTSDVHEEA